MAGNDPTALQELRDRYGAEAGNAEALIEANRLRFPKPLRKASLTKANPQATEKLDAEKVAKAVGVDEDRILGYEVRGAHVVYVVASESGRPLKGVLDRNLKAIEVEDDQADRKEVFDRATQAHAEATSEEEQASDDKGK
jgi:hypothetical protein